LCLAVAVTIQVAAIKLVAVKFVAVKFVAVKFVAVKFVAVIKPVTGSFHFQGQIGQRPV
jgi:hypothetical protein